MPLDKTFDRNVKSRYSHDPRGFHWQMCAFVGVKIPHPVPLACASTGVSMLRTRISRSIIDREITMLSLWLLWSIDTERVLVAALWTLSDQLDCSLGHCTKSIAKLCGSFSGCQKAITMLVNNKSYHRGPKTSLEGKILPETRYSTSRHRPHEHE
jgi:hypothetical protein